MDRESQLIASLKVEITYQHYVALQTIDLHDFSLVKKKVAQDHRITDDEYLNTGIEYLKRYYAIHILDPLNPPAMSKPVDPFWHTHVLYSEDYIAFCDEVFGEYIHHIPLLYEDKIAVRFVSDMYKRTYAKHTKIFGKPDERFFHPDSDGGTCCSPRAATRLKAFVALALFPEEKMLQLLPHQKQ